MALSKELILRVPDDWHLHLRDGALLQAVTPHSSAHFGRAIIMPNLVPPVVTCEQAAKYRARILQAVPHVVSGGHVFDPQMTLYLTQGTDPDDVAAGAKSGLIKAVKLYPAGATTNSQSGVSDIEKTYPVLERMSEIGLPLLVHGEVTDPMVDIFDREAAFIETILDPLRRRFPLLRVVMEHVTTSEGINYVRSQSSGLAATLTVHHLIINRNSLLVGGIKPHLYCLPIAKREAHRLALVEAATSGDKRFFLGTDSAPHVDAAKEAACGCAGMFTSINTMSCLAHVFENENALNNLEKFTSLNGAAFYEVPPNDARIRLVRKTDPVVFPAKIESTDGPVSVFNPGFDLFWQVEQDALAHD